MRFATKAVHAGQQPDPATGAIMPPVYLTSTYVQAAPGEHKGYDYSRAGNPTRTALEGNLAALESARFATAFASGMGAFDGLLKNFRPGDHIVAMRFEPETHRTGILVSWIASLLVYLGVTHDDGPAEVAWTARKVWDLRLLREERSASDVGAPVLVVSQFTLYGDARKGRRPTWQAAAPGPVSEPAYDAVCAELERLGAHVERGRFGADMRVESVNDGPITLVLDSP